MSHYFSFIEQTLHYFDRPHSQPVYDRIVSPAAWRGEEFDSLATLAYCLSDDEVEEIRRAVAVVTDLDKPILELTAGDFPLPTVASRVTDWRNTLASGSGMVVIRGIPVSQWSQSESELFFWCFGLHLGSPGEQNPEGHLLGHVMDTSGDADNLDTRLYKTSANIEFHCDAADVVGLLCLNKAKRGGHSRITSSVSVFNEMLARRPDLVPRLFQPVHLDIRDKEVNEAGGTVPIPPCCYADGQLRTFYHSDYFRSATRHDGVPELTTEELELFDTYEAIAAESGMYFDMDLEPGDIQLLSNHTVLHARTGYEDDKDPAKRRHLLRLWLSL